MYLNYKKKLYWTNKIKFLFVKTVRERIDKSHNNSKQAQTLAK